MDKDLIQQICAIAREAGNVLTSAQDIDNSVKSKEGHANYVTKYDSLIQKLLFEKLHNMLPDAQFMGEEDGAENFKESFKKGFCFIIDPIDGTSNFINQYRPSVISIALLKDSNPYIGIIFNPYSNEMFYAQKDCGAFCNDQQIFSSTKDLSESLVLFGTAPYNTELRKITFDTALYYFDRCADLRRSGSAAWDLCCIARGNAAVFFEYVLGVWDYAAGFLLVSEAGGKVTDISGNPLTFDKKTSVIAVSQSVKNSDYLPKL